MLNNFKNEFWENSWWAIPVLSTECYWSYRVIVRASSQWKEYIWACEFLLRCGMLSNFQGWVVIQCYLCKWDFSGSFSCILFYLCILSNVFHVSEGMYFINVYYDISFYILTLKIGFWNYIFLFYDIFEIQFVSKIVGNGRLWSSIIFCEESLRWPKKCPYFWSKTGFQNCFDGPSFLNFSTH